MSHLLLTQLEFDNRFVRELPADPIADNYRRQVANACYSFVNPTHVGDPKLVCAATEVADLINVAHSELSSDSFTEIFSGNKLLTGMQPHACCYGGHQFGNWAGQLGDGRAINLGEVKTVQGEHWTLQLKGAGPTPYSRTADGLAVLRSSVREFLCSEAMHHLGVPTTRALSLILTGEQVRRDMFYDGNPQLEPGAVVCRVAQSFTRFGNFEILSARNDVALLKQLVSFTIRNDYSHLLTGEQLTNAQAELPREVYVQWFDEVCTRTAHMIAHWMRVGFVHGVMNTDNMSILGLTIDYGPYGWLEGYDPDWTPNTTDAQGKRYRFINQPQVALWNLAQLGNAIYPLIEAVEPLQEGLHAYQRVYAQQWQTDMANKLGFKNFNEKDIELVDELHRVLLLTETDMTIFYRLLANIDAQAAIDDNTVLDVLSFAFYTEPTPENQSAITSWLRTYVQRLAQDYILHGETNAERKARMNCVNPKYVLRNYMAQQAIDKATLGDYAEVQQLLQLLRKPYDEQPEYEHYFAKRPEWARTKAGCSMLSCSS